MVHSAKFNSRGNLKLLEELLTALFCSTRCLGRPHPLDLLFSVNYFCRRIPCCR